VKLQVTGEARVMPSAPRTVGSSLAVYVVLAASAELGVKVTTFVVVL
jgi:hypothetical protein